MNIQNRAKETAAHAIRHNSSNLVCFMDIIIKAEDE